MGSTPPHGAADSSYIAQDLLSSLARPKMYRGHSKKGSAPSQLRQSTIPTSKSMAQVSASPLKAEVDQMEDEADEPGTAKPLTRTMSVHAAPQTSSSLHQRSATDIPEHLMLASSRVPSEPARPASVALTEQVKQLKEALVQKDQSLASKDKELAQLRDKLNKSEKKRAASAAAAPVNPNLANADFKALEAQFAQQERLLSGYQKENERATAELVALRTKAKQTEAHLCHLYGPDEWEANVFADTPPAGKGKRMSLPGSPLVKNTNALSPASGASVDSPPSSPKGAEASPQKPTPDQPVQEAPSPVPDPHPKQAQIDVAGLMAHIQSVELLVQNMDHKLGKSEANLNAREKAIMQRAAGTRA